MWQNYRSAALAGQIQNMRQAAMQIQQKIPAQAESVPYKPTLAFVQSLWACRNLPTYSQILNDVSQDMDGALKIENINANYTGDKVDVKAFGRVKAPFETAYKGYQALQNRLRKQGYTIVDQRFDTQINASSFLIHFIKVMS